MTLPPANRKLSRRNVLKLGAGSIAALAWGLPVSAAEDAKASENFTFAVINDVHYLDAKCGVWFSKVLTGLKQKSPDLCLIVGDLSEDGSATQLMAMKELIAAAKVPVQVVIGNHDHSEDNQRKAWEKHYPKSFNYAFEHRGWQFVGLDSTQGRAGSGTEIQKPTFDWLAANLPKLDKKRPTILFTHFPLGFMVFGRPKNAADLLEQFAEFNVQAIYNGHFHGQTRRGWHNADLTTNTCCSRFRANHDMDPRKGYFLCTARDGTVHREYVEVDRVNG